MFQNPWFWAPWFMAMGFLYTSGFSPVSVRSANAQVGLSKDDVGERE